MARTAPVLEVSDQRKRWPAEGCSAAGSREERQTMNAGKSGARRRKPLAAGMFQPEINSFRLALAVAQAEAVKFNLMAGAPAPPAQQQDDVAAVLRKLASLHDEGLLTDEEFAAKRAEVIARI
jgi:hypothetical protein